MIFTLINRYFVDIVSKKFEFENQFWK